MSAHRQEDVGEPVWPPPLGYELDGEGRLEVGRLRSLVDHRLIWRPDAPLLEIAVVRMSKRGRG